ncbi:hypothetical protein Ciccas_011297 [Cichlidogyrus casuarinus]|uniref:Cathepsin B-like cysteine proteinase n=1 Tax=Cichlidogyrus casuarinus TaxID=1844966 RepID=A0ABD2PRM9_9PLAT
MVRLILASFVVLVTVCIVLVNSMDLDAMADLQKTSWTASAYSRFDNVENRKKLLGVKRKSKPAHGNFPLKLRSTKDLVLPKQFDARKNWPECKSIGHIGDQSLCGSCWAYSSANSMSDRICIHTGKTDVNVSVADLLSCCTECGDGCDGGDPMEAFLYWQKNGIVTGGDYGSEQGCKPYLLPPCEHHTNGSRISCDAFDSPTPQCTSTCRIGYDKHYHEDMTYSTETYVILYSELGIMRDLYLNGPLVLSLDVYEDFMIYQGGIYKHVAGNYLGGHAVRLIGWGEEKGDKYWLIANSWNTNWGENGLVRIRRGTNECKIEEFVVAGIPK